MDCNDDHYSQQRLVRREAVEVDEPAAVTYSVREVLYSLFTGIIRDFMVDDDYPIAYVISDDLHCQRVFMLITTPVQYCDVI